MFGYDYKFTDIQKQIAVADLSEEQIQELFNLLQTKKSGKPELTKEEKAFFQCCREHRSYANNKDVDTVVCPHCGSVKVIKYGKSNGRQRYLCKNCEKTFGDTHIEQTLVPHFTDDTVLVTDSHRAYKTVANKYKIPLNQIPSGKHTSGGFHLGHVNGYHHNISDFMYLYHGVSSKFLDYYLALFYWVEKNKGKTYLEQAYDIITLLANQTRKIPLDKFKYKPISFDMKRLAI